MTDKSEQEQNRLRKFLSFSGIELSSDNRWVVMAKLIPWAELEDENHNLSKRKKGALIKPFRMALATLILKEKYEMNNSQLIAFILENPYLQYFIGLSEFTNIKTFEPSMVVNFQQNIDKKIIDKVNQIIVENQITKTLENLNT